MSRRLTEVMNKSWLMATWWFCARIMNPCTRTIWNLPLTKVHHFRSLMPLKGSQTFRIAKPTTQVKLSGKLDHKPPKSAQKSTDNTMMNKIEIWAAQEPPWKMKTWFILVLKKHINSRPSCKSTSSPAPPAKPTKAWSTKAIKLCPPEETSLRITSRGCGTRRILGRHLWVIQKSSPPPRTAPGFIILLRHKILVATWSPEWCQANHSPKEIT